MRDLLAPGADDLPAEEQPGPLSRQEALELLALSEVIARKAAYGRQLTVRSARAARASWTQNRRCSGHHQAIRVGGPQPVDRPAAKPITQVGAWRGPWRHSLLGAQIGGDTRLI